MSSLLEQAFVDAKALKEAALKNAESAIVEKYSDEVKETLNKLLEQDELGLGGGMDMGMDPMAAAAPDADVDVPLAATDGDELCACPDEEDKEKITIKFDELAEALQKLEEEIDSDSINEDDDDDDDDVAARTPPYGDENKADFLPKDVRDKINAKAKNEEVELDEELDLSALVAAVMENFDLDESEEELEEEIEVSDLEESSYGGAHGRWADADDGFQRCKAKCEPDDSACADDCAKKWPHPTYESSGSGVSAEPLDTDSLIDAVMEKLTVDMGADLSGWAGRRAEDKKYEMEKELAARRSTSLEQDSYLGRGMDDRTDTDPQKELKDLKQAQEEVVFENNQLKEKLQDYENVVEQLKESVTDVNLSNARLLYTNRVLRNTSLNERQKDKIAEAISKAGSVPEARTIYNTLQSTVESAPKRAPQSLSETINRRSSILRASSRKETANADPLADRMKKLAGIN